MAAAKVELAGRQIGPIGTGLMHLTAFRPVLPSHETSSEVVKAAIEGGSNFLNSATFYGNPPNLLDNLKFLNKFFTANPSFIPQVVLSIKGCTFAGAKGFDFNTTPEGVDKSFEDILATLGDKFVEERKKAGLPVIDIFEPSRVNKDIPIEITVGQIKKWVEKGVVGGIGLSEASVATVRRAHAVHPVAGLEIEYSLWATEAEENGAFEVCKELGIPVVAYSPIGRGFLTGNVRSLDDLDANDFRKHLDRFQPQNFDKNLVLVDRLNEFAKKKGVTPAQLAISWARARGAKFGVTVIPIPGSTRVEQTKENVVPVDITDSELNEIQKILDEIKPVGGRYSDAMVKGGMQLYGDSIELDEYKKQQSK